MVLRLRFIYPSCLRSALRLLLLDSFLLLAAARYSLLAFLRYVRFFFCFPFSGRCNMSIISSLFSLHVFNIFRPVGNVMSAGVQVASMISLPRFDPDAPPGSSSLFFDDDLFSDAFFTSSIAFREIISFSSDSFDLLKRFRKCTNIEGSKGCSSLYPLYPRKYCKYGFSRICSTVSSSLVPRRSLMIKAPRAIRTDLAGGPRFDLVAALA